MTSRAELYALIDALPEEALPAVARYLEAVLAGCPPDNPYDDEPLSPEEEAMIRRGYDRGFTRGFCAGRRHQSRGSTQAPCGP
jgi:hypothetical protein